MTEENEETRQREYEEANKLLFSCYISACPEPRNTNFKHPEFMICYRSQSDYEETKSIVKYYCTPVSIKQSENEGSREGVLEISPLIPQGIHVEEINNPGNPPMDGQYQFAFNTLYTTNPRCWRMPCNCTGNYYYNYPSNLYNNGQDGSIYFQPNI